MQTFIPYPEPKDCARVLDRQRLGKQRVECVQILNALVGLSSGWTNHPATKMWKGYEAYLLRKYLKAIIDEWTLRGYKNTKIAEHYKKLSKLITMPPVKPPWITEEFCRSHQSNLVHKKPEHYRKFFPNVPDDLDYIWPVR